MALITRVSRLFKADLHAVLDSIEEPQALLKQAVRDMEEDLQRSRQQLGLMQHENEQLERRSSDLGKAIARLDEELDICFQSNKEDLARSIIKRKLETEAIFQHVSHKAELLYKKMEVLRKQLKENSARYESMRQKSELLAGDSPNSIGSSVRSQDGTVFSADFVISDDQVEVVFLKEQQRHQNACAGSQATGSNANE